MTDPKASGEGDSTWGKLRRRKVVRWGIAYTAGAWALLQVIGFLADAFHWPDATKQVAAIVLAIGLPIAVVLAWYHGDRGHQKPVRSELAVIAVLLLLGGGALGLYQRQAERTATPATSQATQSAPGPATASKTAPSVAVLPFTNLSADPANEYLADGIAETMITMLAQVPQLLVIGKNSSFSYKGQNTDLRTIGQQLGVGALLEGSVQRAGDRLRVAVQLVSTNDGRHLWAETYDRPTADMFAVQDDIAKRVIDALSVALAGKSGPGSIGTTNVAAYDAYLRGKQLVARREVKALEEGVALLEQAVATDPGFARAWAELSWAYHLSGHVEGGNTIGRMSPEQADPLRLRAARNAVEAAPDLGRAHAALALALFAQEDEDGASEEYRRAIALSPDDPDVIKLHAAFMTDSGHPKEAVRLFEPLLIREPRDAAVRTFYARALDGSGDVRGALRQYKEAMRLQPDGAWPYLIAGIITSKMIGATDLSMRLLRRAARLDADNPTATSMLADMYRNIDEPELARQVDGQLRRLGATRDLTLIEAEEAAWAGRPRDARAILEKALVDAPESFGLLWSLSLLPGTQDEYRGTLRRLTEFLGTSLGFVDVLADKQVCLNAWLGSDNEAAQQFAHWEPIWKSRHAFGYLKYVTRTDQLARSLACIGRNDDALTELETLVREGYNLDLGGWRNMAIDPAYDAIRADPRFKAVTDKLKAADMAARARFRARPDLNEADIDSLGT
jgi:TolB-like protein/cytochrome c-type biogenesis protein CcmH/NrfG